ncbi:thiamine pyrophosphate-binding protein [Novosphingobium sp.]|uniref:thiamine pyrophosphate-binding protein n=1 Tax=Novosphingobium sp. TaxID=1874826 RepID=UPI0026341040|nr:thiamine pyrophosphate-binding protein [Novosphingobium sp.]
MPTVRDVTITLMRELGMTAVFGNPGSTEQSMFRDWPTDFHYVMGLQESVVLGMADGFAQGTRHAALVNLHSSADVGHALGNPFTAYKNQTPLVVTAGQQARSILPYEPFLFAERAAEFPRPFVKWSCEPARAEDVPAALYRARRMPRARFMQPARRIPIRLPPAPRLWRGLSGQPWSSAQARRGMVIALAERHQAQVWVAPMSARCSFPEDHPLFAGFLTAGREAIVAALAGHDFVLALGGPMNLYHVEGHGPHMPEGCEVWLIGDNHVHAAWAPAGTAIVAQCDLALEALLGGPAPAARPSPSLRAALPRLDGSAMTDAYVLEQITALRAPDSVIVEEAPSSRGRCKTGCRLCARIRSTARRAAGWAMVCPLRSTCNGSSGGQSHRGAG